MITPDDYKTISAEKLQPFRVDGTPLPPNRVARLTGGLLELAGAADVDAIGFTSQFASNYTQFIWLKNTASKNVFLEAADTILAGEVIHMAADGKVDAAGTVRVGVASRGGDVGERIRVVQD